MLDVEQWAEIRRMAKVERRSQREPSYGPRPKRPSKLGPFIGEIERLLDQEPTLSGVRIREEIEELGYCGGKTILDDLLRELRPRYLPRPRTHQRTVYRPGELAQFDLTEPRREIPVGWDQLRKGYLVTCKLPYSRAFAGALVFSKEFPDIALVDPIAPAVELVLEVGRPSFQPALTDVFAAEPENRIAREERGGGKTSVVGSPM